LLKSELPVPVAKYVNIKGNTTEIQTPDRPAPCVIAQQYSSATVVSIALSFPHEKVRRWSKKFAFQFRLLFLKTNCLSVKLGNLKYRTSDIFCTEWLCKKLRIGII
jgi:hypothetical protein